MIKFDYIRNFRHAKSIHNKIISVFFLVVQFDYAHV